MAPWLCSSQLCMSDCKRRAGSVGHARGELCQPCPTEVFGCFSPEAELGSRLLPDSLRRLAPGAEPQHVKETFIVWVSGRATASGQPFRCSGQIPLVFGCAREAAKRHGEAGCEQLPERTGLPGSASEIRPPGGPGPGSELSQLPPQSPVQTQIKLFILQHRKLSFHQTCDSEPFSEPQAPLFCCLKLCYPIPSSTQHRALLFMSLEEAPGTPHESRNYTQLWRGT